MPAEKLTAKPAEVSWDVAGALNVAGTTAYAAVRAVGLARGDMVAVAGAAGGVGTIAVQLASDAGATVLGIAGPSNGEWLRAHNVDPGQLRGRPRGATARCVAVRPDRRVPRLLRRRVCRTGG